MTTEQVYGEFGDQEHTCGIGAAQVAFGDEPGDYALIMILSEPLNLGDCPAGCNFDVGSPKEYIIHLNDVHHWPRQKIADQLEKLGL